MARETALESVDAITSGMLVDIGGNTVEIIEVTAAVDGATNHFPLEDILSIEIEIFADVTTEEMENFGVSHHKHTARQGHILIWETREDLVDFLDASFERFDGVVFGFFVADTRGLGAFGGGEGGF